MKSNSFFSLAMFLSVVAARARLMAATFQEYKLSM